MRKKHLIILIILFSLSGSYYIYNLAVGMSRNVTDVFGIIDQKLEEANDNAEKNLDSIKKTLEHSQYSNKFTRLSTTTANLNSYIEELKNELISKISNYKNYKEMDSHYHSDALFFL